MQSIERCFRDPKSELEDQGFKKDWLKIKKKRKITNSNCKQEEMSSQRISVYSKTK